jgi:hypothetical protein
MLYVAKAMRNSVSTKVKTDMLASDVVTSAVANGAIRVIITRTVFIHIFTKHV